MRTYRELFAVREFRVLFVSRCVVMISVAASGLAMGTIIYRATGSPVLTGLALFGGPLVSLVTSQLLLSASDSVRPRTALQAQMAGALAANLLQAVPGLPWPARFVVLAIPYVVNSAFSGTQWVIVREIIGDDGYLLARATMNVAVGGMQIVGYGVGGLALTVLSPRDLFLVAAGANLVSLANVRFGIRDRPPVGARTGGLIRRTPRGQRAPARIGRDPSGVPRDLGSERPRGRLRVAVHPLRRRRVGRIAHGRHRLRDAGRGRGRRPLRCRRECATGPSGRCG